MTENYCGYCNDASHSAASCRIAFDALLTQRKPVPEEEIRIPPLSRSTLYVIDTPQTIRAVLSAYSISLSGRQEENRKRLKELARALERRLILKKPSK
jgi:hypothetical protein